MLHNILRAASRAQGGIPRDGLILEYTMDSVSGGYVLDGAGGRDALVEGSPTFVPGVVGDAINLDGDADCLRVGAIPPGDPLQLLGDFTISFWANIEDAGDDYPRILDKSNGGNAANGWSLWLNRGGGEAQAGRTLVFAVDNAGLPERSEYMAVEFQVTQHFAFVCAGGQSRLLVDGVDVPPANGRNFVKTRVNVATDMSVGSWNHGVGRELTGWLDQVRIYNRALSDGEVMQLYQEA